MSINKTTKTILVSGASGIVGYGILKSLRSSGNDYKLIGTTIYEDSVANAFCDVFEKAPPTDSPEYIPWLVEVIEKHEVDLIIPSIEADVFVWSKNIKKLQATDCVVLLNNTDLINLCRDKWLFYKELERYQSEYAIPTGLEFDETKHIFPFLLKPRRGSASQGIVVVNDSIAFEQYKQDLGSRLMLQPIIGSADEEYTVSAFFDKESKLCAHITLKRKLSKNGFTESAQTISIESVEPALIQLAKIFRPIGATNFQFRVQDGQLKLLEINPRISSATSIRAAFGYNESAMSVEYFLDGKEPAQPSIRSGYAVRYTEDMIFYNDSDNI